MQLGSARFKTDDRDCAALTYLARQGRGRHYGEESAVDALRSAVRHRRGLVSDRKVAQQRLHAQLNALCPGCRRRPGTVEPYRWRRRRGWLYWVVRPPLPVGRPGCAH
jgi:Transposase